MLKSRKFKKNKNSTIIRNNYEKRGILKDEKDSL